MTGSDTNWYDEYSDPWRDYKTLMTRTRKKFLKSRVKGSELAAGLNQLIPKFLVAECPQYAGLCQQKAAELTNTNGVVPMAMTNGLVHRSALPNSAESLMDASLYYLASCQDEALLSITKRQMLPYYTGCVQSAIRCQIKSGNNMAAFKYALQAGVAMSKLDQKLCCGEVIEFFRIALDVANAIGDPKIRILAHKWQVFALMQDRSYVEALRCVGALQNIVCSFAVSETAPTTCGSMTKGLQQDTGIMTVLLLLIVGVRNVQLTATQQDMWSYFISRDNITSMSTTRPPSVLLSMSLDLLIILKSYCLAIDESDTDSARFCMDTMWPHLNELQRDLTLKSLELSESQCNLEK